MGWTYQLLQGPDIPTSPSLSPTASRTAESPMGSSAHGLPIVQAGSEEFAAPRYVQLQEYYWTVLLLKGAVTKLLWQPIWRLEDISLPVPLSGPRIEKNGLFYLFLAVVFFIHRHQEQIPLTHPRILDTLEDEVPWYSDELLRISAVGCEGNISWLSKMYNAFLSSSMFFCSELCDIQLPCPKPAFCSSCGWQSASSQRRTLAWYLCGSD